MTLRVLFRCVPPLMIYSGSSLTLFPQAGLGLQRAKGLWAGPAGIFSAAGMYPGCPQEGLGAMVGSPWSAEVEEPRGEEGAGALALGWSHPARGAPPGTGMARGPVPGGP